MNAPVRIESGPLWSLWELIEAYADLAGKALASVTHASAIAAALDAARDRDPDLKETVGPGSLPVQAATIAIDHVRRASVYMDFQYDIGPELTRLEEMLRRPIRVGELHVILHGLQNRIFDILQGKFFLQVDSSDVPLYGKPSLFGALVSAKFPKALEDIEAAGNCLALRQPTATVFHLMRIMEGAVQRLGKLLGVSLNPKSTWYEICRDADKAVSARPGKTARQIARKKGLAAAVTHLQTVRLVWRNDTMHPKQTYTREEAHNIFAAVRTFMIDLAQLI